MKETAVEGRLRKKSEALGALCLKFVSPGNAGVPDRIIQHCGRTIYVETKRPKGQVRLLQQQTIADLRRHGADVRVVDTYALVDAFVEELREMTNGI